MYRGRVACGGFLLLLGACSDGTGPAPPSGGAAAPTNLSAIGDITPNQVSLSWDTVSGAATYNIYWRASPGVTPANGSKITVSNPANAGAGRKGFLDSGRAAGTTYYVVTALGGAGESGPSNEAMVTLADGIGLSINQPQPGAFVADSVYFDVYVQSVFEVASVTAAVENRQVSLVFSNIIPGPGAGWRGYLVLSGLAAGDKQAIVTVRDVKGTQAQASVALRSGVTPVITIQAPLQYTVTRSSLHVVATCQDGAGPCQTTEVRIGGGVVPDTRVFTTNSGTVDAQVDVSISAGQPAVLSVVGLSHSGVGAMARRTVYVEPSPALHDFATVPGRVLDLQPGRVVWLDSTATSVALKLRDLASGSDVTAFSEAGAEVVGAALTSSGAVVLGVRRSGTGDALYAFRNGTLSPFGTNSSFASVSVAGDFAVWNEGSTLLRYQGATGTVITVANDAGNAGNGVAANGDVVYWTTAYLIVRVRSGVATPITSGSLVSVAPITDGDIIVYRQSSTLQGPWQNILTGASGTVVLTTTPPDPGGGYRVNAGWTAYQQLGSADQAQTWTRSPTGEKRQATFFAAGSYFEALGPSGQVIFTDPGNQTLPRRYLAVPPYSGNPTDIGAGSFGLPLYRGSTAYVLIGRSVFTVGP